MAGAGVTPAFEFLLKATTVNVGGIVVESEHIKFATSTGLSAVPDLAKALSPLTDIETNTKSKKDRKNMTEILFSYPLFRVLQERLIPGICHL